MAVTVQPAEVAAALRIGATPAEITEVTRLLAFATEAVERHLLDAYATTPETQVNEAAIRIVGYLYDMPTASRGAGFANAMRNSGASRMLLPYVVHRAGSTGEAVAAAQAAVGTPGNPVTNVAVSEGDLVVTFADGSQRSDPLPAGMGGGVDATARAAAAAAQAAADANAEALTAHGNNANAHHVPPTGGGGAISESARLPVGTVALRLGWAQSQTPNPAFFTRAGNHPTDGAAVGTVAGLQVPPFPPALNTDLTLYLFIWIEAARANIADIRLSGGGGTLIGSISNGVAYELEGVAGTLYVSDQRLSAGTTAFQISAVVGGDLIASQPWVTAQIAAIPPGVAAAPVLIGAVTSFNGAGTIAAFSTATADAFIAAWAADTYRAFLITIAETTGRTHNRWQLMLAREPTELADNHLNTFNRPAATGYSDATFDATLVVNRFTANPDDSLVLNGTFPANASVALYGLA